MQRLRFNAPSHYVLEEGDKTIHGGEEFEVTDERALELLTSPHLDVSEVDDLDDLDDLETPGVPVSTGTGGLSPPWVRRKDLNERARELGVESPETLPNKAAVETAIAEATEPEPEAEAGGGPSIHEDEED
jgi:hypothetical protein